MKKIALYLRVSGPGQTTNNQIPDLERFAAAQCWQITGVYQEQESAWRQGHQRELARLLDDLRSGRRKYDIILTWALDRLSRQGIGHLLQLVSTFEKLGCQVVSVKEAFTQDTGGMRDLFLAIAAWAAKFESDRRSERTRAALEVRQANGVKLGRPVGRKDSKPRHRAGYLNRWVVNKGAAKSEAAGSIVLLVDK